MDAILLYLAKSIAASGLLYLYYYIALRNGKFHSYNRFYLLGSVLLSLFIPLTKLTWIKVEEPKSVPIGTYLTAIHQGTPKVSDFAFGIGGLVFSIVLLISFVLLLMLANKIRWIYTIKKRYKNTRMHGFTFIETTVKQAPFSFLNNLFWKTGVAFDDGNGRKIFHHELVHIKQKHTYDKLFVQSVVCLCWMNPFFWLIQKELTVIHEFIADSGSIPAGDTETFALMLLQSHNEGRYLNPSHTFFQSSIKRRLIMITTSNQTPYTYMRRVLAFPVAILVVALFSVKISHAQTDPKLTPGEGLKVTKVTYTKKATGKSPGDSTLDVKVDYVKPDGTSATLNLNNVGFSPNDSARKALLKLPDETGHQITAQQVRAWVKTIIQNPPDALYYVDGVETPREGIGKLDPSTIKDANILRGDEAIKKYGARGENGVILFGTK